MSRTKKAEEEQEQEKGIDLHGELMPCGHPITDDYAHRDPNPGATHFCMSCAKENEE